MKINAFPCCAMLAVLFAAEAVAMNNFIVLPSPTKLIGISTELDQYCPDSLRKPEPANDAISNVGVAVTNQSSHGITVLTVLWKLTAPSGQIRTYRFVSDSYRFAELTYVIPPGGVAVIWPSSMCVRAPNGQWLSTPNLNNIRRSEDFATASSVQASVDLVAFEDGSFAGEDTRRTILDLIARRQAAKDVSTAVRTAQSAHQSVEQVIAQLSAEDSPAMSAAEVWTRKFARSLKARPNIEPVLRWLEDFPELPKFARSAQ